MDMCDDFAKFYPTKPVIFTKTERTFDTITKTGQDFLDSLPRRSMKLLQLKYFQTVCSLGSITRASALLSVSQPAISAAIKELEREFGVQLFSRVGKSLELTREGQTLLGLSEDLLRRADSAAQVMSDLANQRNRIRLGMPPMLCSILLPQLYGDFTTRFPEVSFEVVEDGRYPLFDKLESGEIKPEGMGIGLRNIHRRVQYAFSDRYGLRIQSQPHHTRIIIHLPDTRPGGSGGKNRHV